MSEQLTMVDAAPEVNDAGLNSAEQESLQIAESLEQGDEPLLAGKFKDATALEQAYLELQKKLGEPKEDAVSRDEEGEQAEAPEEVEEESTEEPETEITSWLVVIPTLSSLRSKHSPTSILMLLVLMVNC
jgi:hypothetical protein